MASDGDPIQSSGVESEGGESRLPTRLEAHVPLSSDTTGYALNKNPALGPGSTIGHYRLVEELGRGGMGVVYRAKHLGLKREVALKLMLAGEFASAEARTRFCREAEAVAALEHPNVVRVFDVGELNGVLFLAMELIQGQLLSEFYSGEASLRTLLFTFMGICDGVQHAHLRGVIHRDLKPQNVIVDKDQSPHILDFGMAKRTAEEGERFEQSLTTEGSVLGTLRYMPPEQATGEIEKIDVRSDVYALGVILYELVTGGKTPFRGGVAQLLYKVLHSDPQPPSVHVGLPWELDAICLKALEKSQEDRYQSALEMRRDVERFLEGLPIHARQASVLYRARKAVRRHLAPIVVVSSLLLLLIGWAVSRRVRIGRLITEARAAPLEERVQKFSQILGEDPDNEIAAAEARGARNMLEIRAQSLLKEEKLKAESLIAEERLKRELLVQKNEREREREARRISLEDALQKARAALDGALAAKNPLQVITSLNRGLSAIPVGSDAPRTELERNLKVVRAELERHLVEQAIREFQAAWDEGKALSAEYWLGVARGVAAAEERGQELDLLQEDLESLRSGQGVHSEAKELFQKGEWLAARDKLQQALKRGVREEALAGDLVLVQARCQERAQDLVNAGRRLLSEGQPERALASAQPAVRFSEGSESLNALATTLLEDCAQQVADGAQRDSHPEFQSVATAPRGLKILSVAALRLKGTRAHVRLISELNERKRQRDDPTLVGLVFVPAVARLSNEAFYISRHEVTNAEFHAFVSAGGYEDHALFDDGAREHMGLFVDATPGATASPGPRIWQYANYGDVEHAQRPVRGVTWYEARAYARWLSRRQGRRWRLPSAREWEIAAGWHPVELRFTRFPWGDGFEQAGLPCSEELPPPVGTTRGDRSPYGLFDMGGSVSEWVEISSDPPRPGLKGASFAVQEILAKHQAQVMAPPGTPGAGPPGAHRSSRIPACSRGRGRSRRRGGE